MATEPQESNTIEIKETWDSYSDFQAVSRDVANAIAAALDAYARVYGRHAEGHPVEPEFAALARAKIMSGAYRVLTEMELEADNRDELSDMLDDWTGEEGYLTRFDDVQLQNECPAWIDDWIRDIRRAGWILGYLRAGQYEREEVGDETETQAHAMFDSL